MISGGKCEQGKLSPLVVGMIEIRIIVITVYAPINFDSGGNQSNLQSKITELICIQNVHRNLTELQFKPTEFQYDLL